MKFKNRKLTCWISSKPSCTASCASMPGGDVPADAHTEAVRLLHDHRHQGGIHRAVDFDLYGAELFPHLHLCDRLIRGRGRRSDRRRIFSGAVHQTGDDHARSEQLAARELRLRLRDVFRIVTGVANRRNALCQQPWPKLGKGMHVHVPQARQQRISAAVDAACIARYRHLRAADCGDASRRGVSP